MDRFEKAGAYLRRDGLAKERGTKNLCKKKVCFVSSDQNFLKETFYSISLANDCFETKIASADRQGMYFGYCYFTNESSVGDAWAKYHLHPKAWVTIEDDDFCENYRNFIRKYE